MPKQHTEAHDELSVMLQEKKRLEKHILEAQKRILVDEKRLTENAPTTQRYQKAFEEWRALQIHVVELQAQLITLDEALQNLKEQQHESDASS